jgi:hypothetical protein
MGNARESVKKTGRGEGAAMRRLYFERINICFGMRTKALKWDF